MIHNTAIISPDAELGENVEVGPYAIIEAGVNIGDGCKIGPRVNIFGQTAIGAGTVIHTGAVIGDTPQDFHYQGELSYTRVGCNCTIREYVTIHRGVQKDSATMIGDNVMMMGLSHAGHNAVIGNHVIMANGALVAGHAEIGERAFLSGNAMVHQFAKVGRLCMVGGGCKIIRDLPPFCLFQYEMIQGLNQVGMSRAGISALARGALKQSYKIYFRQGLNRPQALKRIHQEVPSCPEVDDFVRFIETSERGIHAARAGGRNA